MESQGRDPRRVEIGIDGKRHTVDKRRMGLLDSVRRNGAISRACSRQGITLKTGLRWISELELEFGTKLVDSTKGGKGGGGSFVTDYGLRLIERFFSSMSPSNPGFTRSYLELRMSARNILEGSVTATRTDGEICKVDVVLDSPQHVSAIITDESRLKLGIRQGERVMVIVKATETMLMKP